jgi:hypothetical protein
VIPRGSTQVVRGQIDPYQGWVSPAMLQRIPAPVIAMTRMGSSAAMLTLIAPASPGAVEATRVIKAPGGGYHLDVSIGGRGAAFLVGPDGDIERA